MFLHQRHIKKIILLVVPLILYVGLIGYMPLMEPDEGRYSLIPSTMNRTGDYVTPHLKEVIYIEKPPLCYWATAVAFKIFGENEFSSRLFAGLCAWGCILLVYAMGRYFHDKKTGLYAAAVLTVSLFHLAIGRINILDMPLAFFVCAAVWSGFRYLSDAGRPRRWIYGFYLGCALGFLTKGLIGIVFPGAILVIWLVVSGRWREAFRLFSPVGIIIFLLVVSPWLVLIQKATPDFFHFFFIREHFLRYTTSVHSRNEPFFYFIPVVIAGVIPWLGFLFQAARSAKNRVAVLYDGEEKRFLLTWILFVFLFFSISSSKLIPYIAPLFIPLAVFLGHLFRTYEDLHDDPGQAPPARVIDYLPIGIQALLFAVLLVAPVYIAKHKVPLDQWWPWIAVPMALQILLAVLPEYCRKRWGKGWFAAVYAVTAVFMMTMTFPIAHYLTPFKSAYPVVQAVKSRLPAGQELYQFNAVIYGIDFYGRMRTPIIDDIGELGFGVERVSAEERARYFLISRDFFKLYREGKELWLVTEGEGNILRLRNEAPDMQIMWHNGNYYLIRLKKT